MGHPASAIFSRLQARRATDWRCRPAPRTTSWSPSQAVTFDVTPPVVADVVGDRRLCARWPHCCCGLLADSYRTRLKRRHAWQLAQQKQELAEQASQAKTRFLATLGHEVRTPMTGVLGMSELLLGTPLNPQQRGYVGAIRGAGEHLLRLVNDALDLARIEAGQA